MLNPWLWGPVAVGIVFALSFVFAAYKKNKTRPVQIKESRFGWLTNVTTGLQFIALCGSLAAATTMPVIASNPDLSGLAKAITLLLALSIPLSLFFVPAFKRAPRTSDSVKFKTPFWVGIHGMIFGLVASSVMIFVVAVFVFAVSTETKSLPPEPPKQEMPNPPDPLDTTNDHESKSEPTGKETA
jgi:hypothetical protein